MSELGRLLCRDAVGHSGNSQQPRRGRQDKRFICDSQDLTLHAVLSDGNNTVRYTVGWGRRNGANLRERLP